MAPPLVRLFATWLLLVPAAGIVSAAPLSVPLSRVWSPGVAHSLDRSLGPGPDDFTKDFVTFLVLRLRLEQSGNANGEVRLAQRVEGVGNGDQAGMEECEYMSPS